MVAVDITTLSAEQALEHIRRQHQLVEDMRKANRKEEADASRKLAELMAATRHHPDPSINPSAVSVALKKSRGWGHLMITQLNDGKL